MNFSIHTYSQLDSTNEEALQLIAGSKAREYMVIQAYEQTQGRGAGNNYWESEPGKNLTFSVILQPLFLEPSQLFALTEMISLALFDVVERRLGSEYLSVKWPNDLWYKNKKLAGVLVQNRIKGNRIEFSVIGVGLNVNQKKFFSNAPNPASLIHFSGKEENLSDLLNEILERLGYFYEKLRSDFQSLEHSYMQKLYRVGEWAGYRDEKSRFTAKITGINRYGQLLLTDRQNELRVYGFKEVEFLR